MDTSALLHLGREFYTRDVPEVAPDLLGKIFVTTDASGRKGACRITETEAYRGRIDLACHASKGRSSRTEIDYAGNPWKEKPWRYLVNDE